MALQPYADNNTLAIVPETKLPEISEEERARRAQEAEELEAKLKFINEQIPTRITNVSGSNAGAGSGDFHQYRMARRREQLRQNRIEEEFQKWQENKKFEEKKLQLAAGDADRTAKNRLKRQKKKAKQQVKKVKLDHETNSEEGGADGRVQQEEAEAVQQGEGVQQAELD